MRYSAEGLLQLGPLGSTAFLPDSKCLVDDGRGRTPALKKCEDVARPAQRLWDFTQVSRGLLAAHGVGVGAAGDSLRAQGPGSVAPMRAGSQLGDLSRASWGRAQVEGAKCVEKPGRGPRAAGLLACWVRTTSLRDEHLGSSESKVASSLGFLPS